MAAKMRSALMVEEKMPEDGLAALEGDGQDMFVALARQITEGRVQDGHSLEAMFAQAQAVEAEADGYLVEGVWPPEPGAGPGTVLPGRVLALAPDTSDVDGAAAWRQVFADKTSGDGNEEVEPVSVLNGRVIDFGDLAQMLRQRRRRQKPAPEGQLSLF
ncbi:MAG: hypothetical protein U0822_08050 [Anaerolineae bacterium]